METRRGNRGARARSNRCASAGPAGRRGHPASSGHEEDTLFERLREAAGIPIGTLHVLRHTHTTLALSEGVPLHVVAARIGDHPATMLSTYAHLLPSTDSAAAEQVAALVAR